MAPIACGEERSPDARFRFLFNTAADPFFWVLVAVLAYSAVAALNGGVALAYDPEQKLWRLTSPSASVLPGSADGAGGIYFSSVLLVSVLYPAVVHSLDTRQNVYFAITASITAVIDAVFAYVSGVGIDGRFASAYGLLGMVAAAAMFSAEDNRRRPKELLSSLALSGCVAAMMFSGCSIEVCVFGAAILLLTLVFIAFRCRELGAIGVFRALLMLVVAAGIAAALFQWRSGEWTSLLPVWEGSETDALLNRFAVQAWQERPWTGFGVGSFPLVAKINATAEDWMTLGAAPDFYSNGWRALLVERGTIGLLAVALSFGALLFTWFRFAWKRGFENFSAAVPLLPLALAGVSVSMVFDGSAMQPEAIVAFAALAAFSVNGGQ